ncbi:hypothetical protein OIU79_001554 [Salix purpurea]|uniref:Uncharacterized protein n=1 Tax=Salix purpurea TaxID=77065 RepID=A0A9Q0UQ87_SALPP|nr:hypothetical protein OIU79_001554 [Salix purpurea]
MENNNKTANIAIQQLSRLHSAIAVVYTDRATNTCPLRIITSLETTAEALVLDFSLHIINGV